MTEHPSVSAVVPTRDRPELLRAAVRAILDQDHPGPIEVVVVYDQSEPDASLAELSRPDRLVRVIRNERAPGLAGARNSGVLAATGELVAFCDDDDEWLPGKLRAQVEALAAHPDAEFVSCGIRVSYDGHTVDRALPKDSVTLADLLRDRMTELHPSTFLIRAAALRDGFGLVDEEIPGSYAEDYEFLLRAARSAPLVNLRTPYVLVRWHKRSYFAQRWDTISEALQWLLERYPEFGTQPAGEARVTGQIAFARAASGDRRGAMRWARHTIRRNPREPRAYLALAVAGRMVRADAVLRTLHKRGRGI
ncbi:glycosyltransferase family 2 protein [Micromonospora sp. DSM 115977]|uniref:Glycosyltransferase family 2 protein n=1 Tax=Micromonospora reichwaldensis TaxID=3075516 RepID=A0ABU2X4D9_9ACTN|nr:MULTISPECIES: glycosyltransferase family 2 protein [unclassified Micromonospora]KAB1129683.1 glycosyltransferase family 2 protein [Micromonospora sp. AMSO12t]MDT0532734.1 glycosyltransferase family 2 protein [Micromonospora sp. DSM 115977]WSF99658.1 glycosyltransferase [Micromonospora sp. NBC_01740]